MTTYKLRATALCPNDGSRDHYDVEVVSDSRIDIEELKAWFDDYANREIYQEDMAAQSRAAFLAEVRITGSHPAAVEIVT